MRLAFKQIYAKIKQYKILYANIKQEHFNPQLVKNIPGDSEYRWAITSQLKFGNSQIVDWLPCL